MSGIGDIIGAGIILILLGLGLYVFFYPLETLLPKDFWWIIPDFLKNTSFSQWFLSTDIQTKLFLLVVPAFAIGAIYIVFSD